MLLIPDFKGKDSDDNIRPTKSPKNPSVIFVLYHAEGQVDRHDKSICRKCTEKAPNS